VDGVVLVAQLLGGASLHKRSCLGRSSVLVSPWEEQGLATPALRSGYLRRRRLLTTNVEGVDTAATAIAGKTSAERTDPIIFPRCGTLLTWGSALVIKTFFLPGCGRTTGRSRLLEAMVWSQSGAELRSSQVAR
jgi:hypothetical protein